MANALIAFAGLIHRANGLTVSRKAFDAKAKQETVVFQQNKSDVTKLLSRLPVCGC